MTPTPPLRRPTPRTPLPAASSQRRSLAPSRRPAFTTVELLVAIGIIVILVGIGVWGLSGAGGSGRVKATRVTLENCKNLLFELKSRREPTTMWVGGAKVDPTQKQGDAIDFFNGVVEGPRNVQAAPDRYDSDAVLNTQLLMGMLRGVPLNRSALANIPSDQLLSVPSGATITNLKVLTSEVTDQSGNRVRVADPPVLLDGWGNPIIFVPRGGLIVTISGTGRQRITSSGAERADGYDPSQPVPTRNNAQPFFASAGPDGDFSKGDDNVYSFEN